MSREPSNSAGRVSFYDRSSSEEPPPPPKVLRITVMPATKAKAPPPAKKPPRRTGRVERMSMTPLSADERALLAEYRDIEKIENAYRRRSRRR